MVEFLLILELFRGGIETVPHHFQSYELCEKAGEQIERSTRVQKFLCIEVQQKCANAPKESESMKILKVKDSTGWCDTCGTSGTCWCD